MHFLCCQTKSIRYLYRISFILNEFFVKYEYATVQHQGFELSLKDMWDLPCLLHILTWLYISEYRNFWNNERWKSFHS